MDEITAQAFAEKIKQGKATDEQWIDVREVREWEIDRIDEADLIPMGELPMRLAELDPEKKLYLLCAHGVRSLHVQHFLREQGFEQVINVEGGLAKVRVCM